MKALFLVALLALPAFAANPAEADDAPYVEKLEQGQPAPLDGVFMNKLAIINIAQEISVLQEENTALKKESVAPWVVVVLVSAGLLVGAGAGVGIGFALKK